jgi:hypothetical protein
MYLFSRIPLYFVLTFICGLVIALWFRSYFYCDSIRKELGRWESGPGEWVIISDLGVIFLQSSPEPSITERGLNWHPFVAHDPKIRPFEPTWGFGYRTFSRKVWESLDDDRDFLPTYKGTIKTWRQVAVPYWLVAVLFGGLAWLVRFAPRLRLQRSDAVFIVLTVSLILAACW